MLTVGKLREIIENLPDDMEVYLTASMPREIMEVTVERAGTPAKQKTAFVPFAVESAWGQFPIVPGTERDILMLDANNWSKHGIDNKSLI